MLVSASGYHKGKGGLGVEEQSRREAGEEAESLQDGVERGQQHDAGEQEGDLARPGGAVEVAVPVGGQQGEDVVDRVAGGEGRGGRLPPAAQGGEGGGADAVGAVEGEDVVD